MLFKGKQEVGGGVPALNRLPYPSLIDGEVATQRCDMPWWQNQVVIVCFVVALGLLDAAVLFTLIDNVMTETAWISKFVVGGVALSLNFIPLIIGFLVREIYYKKSRVHIAAVLGLVVTLLALFTATFNLRWATRALSFSGAGNTLVDTTAQNITTTAGISADGAIASSLTVLLGILPLITSAISAFLGFICNDPIRRKINRLRLELIELNEMLNDCLSARFEMAGERIAPLLLLEEENYNAAKQDLAARCNYWKQYARFKLAEHLAEPSKITTALETKPHLKLVASKKAS